MATAATYIGVYTSGASRYVPLSDVLTAMSGLNATFKSLKTPAGSLVPGPTTAAFTKVKDRVDSTIADTTHAAAELADLEALVTAIENHHHPKAFDGEFSKEFD